METFMNMFEGNSSGKYLSRVTTGALFALAMSLTMVPISVAGQSRLSGHATIAQRTSVHPLEAGQQSFSTAAEASDALVFALQKEDEPSLLHILGADAKNIISSGDDAEDAEHRAQFVQKYRQLHRMVTESDGLTTLYIGAENWPSPIPLVHKGDSWYFDTIAAKNEILYRRVGENELTVIKVCNELVDAQKEYNSELHDGSPDRQYAQKILSDPDKHNGLYWKPASGEAVSPLGPLVASAEREGYTEIASQKPVPFHGYYFRVLKGQGPHASEGIQSYIVNGKMTRGFAFVAYPAEYRSSGVMTFLISQDGVVYEKDLGRNTGEIVKSLVRYNRDVSWRKAD
jgi:hypothetical protein